MEIIQNNRPFFSVVIPTYNRSEELQICLSKLVDQIFKNFEVIICDDGSTDNTKEIVQAFENKLNLVYFYNQNSGGPAKPRNIGIRHSKGTWIAFLDSDDLWYNNKLEVIFNIVNDNCILDFISHDLIITNNLRKNKVLRSGPVEFPDFYKKLLLFGNRFPNSSIVVRKDFITLNCIFFNESSRFSSVEDYDFVLKIAMFKGIMFNVNISLGEYTIHNQNISNNEKHLINLKYLLIYHAYYVQEFSENRRRFALKLFCRYNIIRANYYLKNYDYVCFFKYMIYAISISPELFIKYLLNRFILFCHNLKYRLGLDLRAVQVFIKRTYVQD